MNSRAGLLVYCREVMHMYLVTDVLKVAYNYIGCFVAEIFRSGTTGQLLTVAIYFEHLALIIARCVIELY